MKKINEKTLIKPDSIYGVSKYAGEMFMHQILKIPPQALLYLEYLILTDQEKT